MKPVPGVFENPVILEILERYRVVWALGHAASLMSWDSETYMPPGGVEERALARGELARLRQRLILDPELVKLVEKAEGLEGLNDYERGVVRVLSRAIRIARSIPPELVAEEARLSEEARRAWREARERSDFSSFKPYLERIVEVERRKAEHLGYEDHPYDALLDLYEEGLRVRDMDRYFQAIIPTTKAVLERVRSGGFYPERHPLEEVRYDAPAMERVNRAVLDMLGYPWDRGRLDLSAHPFTIDMGVGDVRITTRYEGYDFRRALFSTIHEFGHALYELQVDERLKATPLVGGVSMGVHESQSRFWENVVGRSPAFAGLVKGLLDENLGFTRDYDAVELYRYFALVRPIPIRVDSDELTYNLHIYLRYELEKGMITGEVKVGELSELWNEMSEELIGVRPRNDAEGVLQDIHWSMASIGYFPTYTLGNLVAAMIWKAADASLGGLYRLVEEARFSEVREFLRERIHRWGSTYEPKVLVEKALGEPVNSERFNEYITWKYVELPKRL
ncbi:carboxypeptidase M32 [Stetteria hydrogenophila]